MSVLTAPAEHETAFERSFVAFMPADEVEGGIVLTDDSAKSLGDAIHDPKLIGHFGEIKRYLVGLTIAEHLDTGLDGARLQCVATGLAEQIGCWAVAEDITREYEKRMEMVA